MTEQEPKELDRLDQLAEAFKALGNEHRLRLLHLLTHPKYGNELADELQMTRQNALRHVSTLEEQGFVRSMHGRRETGPVVEYQVVPQHLYALAVALEELAHLEAEGGPEIPGSPPTLDDELPKGVTKTPSIRGHHLLLLDGPEAGERLALEEGGPRWRIGRLEEADLVLDHDPYISNLHAEVQAVPSGHSVVDVHSSNGTFVNFERLPSGGRVLLQPGDVVRVGHTRLVYQRE